MEVSPAEPRLNEGLRGHRPFVGPGRSQQSVEEEQGSAFPTLGETGPQADEAVDVALRLKPVADRALEHEKWHVV